MQCIYTSTQTSHAQPKVVLFYTDLPSSRFICFSSGVDEPGSSGCVASSQQQKCPKSRYRYTAVTTDQKKWASTLSGKSSFLFPQVDTPINSIQRRNSPPLSHRGPPIVAASLVRFPSPSVFFVQRVNAGSKNRAPLCLRKYEQL